MNSSNLMRDMFRIYWENAGPEFITFLRNFEEYKLHPEFVDCLEKLVKNRNEKLADIELRRISNQEL